jgi:hypothetical protein
MQVKAFAMMIALTGFTMLPYVKADDWNKETVVTLNKAVAVPGQVLAPGRYVFKLGDEPSDRNIVQIFNEDQSHIIATFLTGSAQRSEPTDDTVLTIEEQPAGSPGAVGKWFFAGEQRGVEFLYHGTQR